MYVWPDIRKRQARQRRHTISLAMAQSKAWHHSTSLQDALCQIGQLQAMSESVIALRHTVTQLRAEVHEAVTSTEAIRQAFELHSITLVYNGVLQDGLHACSCYVCNHVGSAVEMVNVHAFNGPDAAIVGHLCQACHHNST